MLEIPDVAFVRRAVELVDGVARTWIEWESDEHGSLKKTLVVQVRFDTDPNSSQHRPDIMAAIQKAIGEARRDLGVMKVNRLKIVPAH